MNIEKEICVTEIVLPVLGKHFGLLRGNDTSNGEEVDFLVFYSNITDVRTIKVGDTIIVGFVPYMRKSGGTVLVFVDATFSSYRKLAKLEQDKLEELYQKYGEWVTAKPIKNSDLYEGASFYLDPDDDSQRPF